jgi:uncharacterized protein
MNSRAGMILLALCWLCGAGRAAAPPAIPPSTARLTDLTGTLSGATVARLEQRLAAFETHKGVRIAVLMVPTTQPEDMARYSVRLADAWQLGRKAGGDGAILIVAKRDRQVRIEVGPGLARLLSDPVAARIVTDTITPHFRAGDFDGGVEAGVSQMIAVASGEPLPPPDHRRWNAGRGGHLRLPYPLLLVALLVGVAAGVLAFALSVALGSARGWASGAGWGRLDDRREAAPAPDDRELGGGASGSW